MQKIIVITGPTASGKSKMAVDLALWFKKAEIISADSRQVYKGMNIGSGKITKKEMKGVPHRLLDVASPKKRFTVSQYRKLALKAIKKIFTKGELPIICGGSWFYIKALIEGLTLPEVKPDRLLRLRLEKLSADKLFLKLKKIDPKRAENIDNNNKRRLIRALEIVIKTGKSVPALKTNPLPYPMLVIGIKKDKEELKKIIRKRILKRLKEGMIKEIESLKKSGLSWKRLEEFGLEYRWIAKYLQKKISYKEMAESLQKDIEGFVKRQMVWLKKEKRINWVSNYNEAKKLVKGFLK